MPQHHPGFRKDWYYGPAGTPDARAWGYLYGDAVSLVLTFIPYPMVIDRIGLEVTWPFRSSDTLRLGAYQHDPQRAMPSEKIFQTNEISVGSAAIKEINISWNPVPGWYWLALASSYAQYITTRNDQQFDNFIHGSRDTLTNGYYLSYSPYSQGDDLPQTLTNENTVLRHNNIPYIWVRRSNA